jgi:hypothetical protein
MRIVIALGALAIACSVLSACATPEPPALTPDQAAAVDTEKLCWGYHGYGQIDLQAAQVSRQTIRNELDRRGAVTSSEWTVVDGLHIDKGLGRCAVLALFGKPAFVTENSRVTVLTFGNAAITLINGRVTAYTVPEQYLPGARPVAVK